MTKSLVWILLFLVAFAALFVLQQLTRQTGTSSMDAGYYNGMGEAGGTADTSNLSGKELLGKFECTRCHGDDLNGTPMAPPLKGMAKYYDRESLIAYLRSPERNQTGTRFDEYKTKYATGVMPAFGNKDVKDLGKIADYLLGQ